jgi:hypothetical protein
MAGVRTGFGRSVRRHHDRPRVPDAASLDPHANNIEAVTTPPAVPPVTAPDDAFGHPVPTRTVDGTNGRLDLLQQEKVTMSSKPSNLPNAALPTSKTFDVELDDAKLDAVNGGFVPGALATAPKLHQVTGSDSTSYLD